MSYPDYTRSERIADGVVHVLGVTLALSGIVFLFFTWSHQMGWGTFTAVAVYAVGLVAMLTASACYHIAAHTPARPLLRRLDHAAIYVKIAGTFTPLAVFLGSGFAYFVLFAVWILALIGAKAKLMTKPGKMTTGTLPYLALGWIGVALFIPLSSVLPGLSLGLLLAGGFMNTVGVVFFCWENLRYANAIWHVFVLGASACFFTSIASALAASI